MANVKVSMAINVGNATDGHDFDQLTIDEAKKLGEHLLDHAQKQIMHAWPDDQASVAGDTKVSFDYVVTQDGTEVFSETLRFGSLNDQGVQMLRGIFDGAVAKLDKKIAAKGHKHSGRKVRTAGA